MKQSNAISLLSTLAKISGLALFVLISATATAQTRGTVTVTKDARIDTLIAKRLELKQTQGNVVQGFRVQLFMGSDRAAAYSAQAKFYDLHPDVKTYVSYNEPNFIVKAGDFKTRLQATQLMEQLRKLFTALIVIPEKINLPKTDGDD